MPYELNPEIHLDFDVASRILREKLRRYADLFDRMEKRGGWMEFPPGLLNYVQQLGVIHWAELFSKDGLRRYQEIHKGEIRAAQDEFLSPLGPTPTPDEANAFLNEFCEVLTESAMGDVGDNALPGLEFLEQDPSTISVISLSQEELNLQRSVWLTFFVHFFNDLALATHAESLFSLVNRALEERDEDALVKAIQIDRSLIAFFHAQLWQRSMDGSSGFWDSFAYRANNPPTRGRNEYPLLWVLFKDLKMFGCLDRSVTARQILDLYSDAISEHPRLAIDDEATIQRQKRKFLKLYRPPK